MGLVRLVSGRKISLCVFPQVRALDLLRMQHATSHVIFMVDMFTAEVFCALMTTTIQPMSMSDVDACPRDDLLADVIHVGQLAEHKLHDGGSLACGEGECDHDPMAYAELHVQARAALNLLETILERMR